MFVFICVTISCHDVCVANCSFYSRLPSCVLVTVIIAPYVRSVTLLYCSYKNWCFTLWVLIAATPRYLYSVCSHNINCQLNTVVTLAHTHANLLLLLTATAAITFTPVLRNHEFNHLQAAVTFQLHLSVTSTVTQCRCSSGQLAAAPASASSQQLQLLK
jgi:hypothetical protein